MFSSAVPGRGGSGFATGDVGDLGRGGDLGKWARRCHDEARGTARRALGALDGMKELGLSENF